MNSTSESALPKHAPIGRISLTSYAKLVLVDNSLFRPCMINIVKAFEIWGDVLFVKISHKSNVKFSHSVSIFHREANRPLS
jgi:hypothetical protein